jgi:hypothetical protein
MLAAGHPASDGTRWRGPGALGVADRIDSRPERQGLGRGRRGGGQGTARNAGNQEETSDHEDFPSEKGIPPLSLAIGVVRFCASRLVPSLKEDRGD